MMKNLKLSSPFFFFNDMWAIADITFSIYKLFFGMGKEIHFES